MSVQSAQGRSRAASSDDVTAGEMVFQFEDIDPISSVVVAVRTAAGAVKAWNGAVSVDGKRVTVDNSGSTDFAATDVVSVFVGHG